MRGSKRGRFEQCHTAALLTRQAMPTWRRSLVRKAQISVRSGARAPRHKGWHLHRDPLRRSEEEGLDRDQHEERLEARLYVRIKRSMSPNGTSPSMSVFPVLALVLR